MEPQKNREDQTPEELLRIRKFEKGLDDLERAKSEGRHKDFEVLEWLDDIDAPGRDFQKYKGYQMHGGGNARSRSQPSLAPSDSLTGIFKRCKMAELSGQAMVSSHPFVQEDAGEHLDEWIVVDFHRKREEGENPRPPIGGIANVRQRATANRSEGLQRVVRTHQASVRGRLNALILEYRGSTNIPPAVLAQLPEAEQQLMREHIARVHPKEVEERKDESS